jgi:putative membrane protein
MILNNKDKNFISKEIEKIKTLSSVQLFIESTKKSSKYQLASCMFAIFILFFFSFLMISTIHIDALELLQIQLLIFFGFYFLLEKSKNSFIKILPKFYKHQVASKNAIEQFDNLEWDNTKKKVMFFISFDEKYAEILVDDEIADVIPNSHWEAILNEFSQEIKENNFSTAYLKAIIACSSILIEKFPLKESK